MTSVSALHLFIHSRSEAVAAVDMICASLTYAAGQGITPSGRLFLAGYSQGGHATLALQKELEMNHTTELPVTASAPMAGPHDLSGTMRNVMIFDNVYSQPAYLAYLIIGMQGVYGLYDDPSEIF